MLIDFSYYLQTKVLSENFLYKPGVHRFGKRFSTYLYLNPIVDKYEENIKDTVLKSFYQKYSKIPDNIAYIVGSYIIGMNKDTFYNKDLSNTIKSIEDGTFRALKLINSKLDDSQVITYCPLKIMVDSEDKEFILGNIIISTDLSILPTKLLLRCALNNHKYILDKNNEF